MNPLQRLIARINRAGDINDPSTPRPLVTLEEFFEGNDEYGSIGYNFHEDQPSPAEFYELFKEIRARPDVADVRVQVTQHEMIDEWPSSDTIWIVTKVAPNDVTGWLGERFRADEILIGWPQAWTVEAYSVPTGMKALGVWWD